MRMRQTAGRKCDRGSKDCVTNLTRSFSSSFSSFIKLNFVGEKCSKVQKKYAFGYFRDDFLDCFGISDSPALKSRHRIFVKPENICPFKYINLVK